MYVYTHKCTHRHTKKAKYERRKYVSKTKHTLLLMTSTVNSAEAPSEISVILMKCIFIHVAYSDCKDSFYFTNKQHNFSMSVL